MHRDKETDLESLDELSTTKGIAITYAPVNGKLSIYNLTDVFQLTQIQLLMGYWVYLFIELLTINRLTRHGFWQESRIPVVKSPAWKIRFPSVSTIHETPLSVLPNAHTDKVPSNHVPLLVSFIILHTSCCNEVLLQSLHAFQVQGSYLHPLVKHSFAIVGSNYKLHNLMFVNYDYSLI